MCVYECHCMCECLFTLIFYQITFRSCSIRFILSSVFVYSIFFRRRRFFRFSFSSFLLFLCRLSLLLVFFVYFSCTRFIWFAHRATAIIIIINIIIVIRIEYICSRSSSRNGSLESLFFFPPFLFVFFFFFGMVHPLLSCAYPNHTYSNRIKNILHSFNIQNIVKSWHFVKTIQCFVCAVSVSERTIGVTPLKKMNDKILARRNHTITNPSQATNNHRIIIKTT